MMRWASKGVVAALFAAVTLTIAAGAASATTAAPIGQRWSSSVPCLAAPVTAQYFAPWGDENEYFLAPGGNFSGWASWFWTMSGGASTTSGGDPWNVTGSDDLSSLLLPAGAAATSGSFCVDSNEPTMRFFYDSPGIAGATLSVSIDVTGADGSEGAAATYELDGSVSGWTPSPALDLPAMYDATGEEVVTVSFAPIGTPAQWQLDDVMVDPWASR